MILDEENDDFILSSGEKMYANELILGISEKDGSISVTGGYDQLIQNDSYCEVRDGGLTKEEKKEIAEYVISLWNKWALT